MDQILLCSCRLKKLHYWKLRMFYNLIGTCLVFIQGPAKVIFLSILNINHVFQLLLPIVGLCGIDGGGYPQADLVILTSLLKNAKLPAHVSVPGMH